MARDEDGNRRSSQKERRVFRTAQSQYVQLGRIVGIDPAAASFLRGIDVAPARQLRFGEWSEQGLEVLLLTQPPILVGYGPGHADLTCVANWSVLAAAQQHWPPDRLIHAVVLAYQVSPRTRRSISGGSLVAAGALANIQALSEPAFHRVWTQLIEEKLNPLATDQKMNLVRVLGCNSRKLPPVRGTAAGEV